jgi:hypothetical protein
VLRLGDTLGETLAAAAPLGATLAVDAIRNAAPWWRATDRSLALNVQPSAVIVTTMAAGGNAAAIAIMEEAA